MKYGFLPRIMWLISYNSFQKQLYLFSIDKPKLVMKKAKTSYRTILGETTEFDEGDRFITNILSAAILAAVYQNLKEKPKLDDVTTYYHKAMTESTVMKFFLKNQNLFSEKTQANLALQAEASQTRANPYTWKFRYEAGPNINSFSTYFDTCGICYLFHKLGIPEIIAAMCVYDYAMGKLAGAVFTRQNTLEKGGACCDCHYQKSSNK